MLAIERHGRAIFARVFIQLVPPMVAARLHRRLRASALINDDVAHAGAFGERFVHGRLELDLFAAPPAAVGRDDHHRAQVLDARLQRFGRKASEHDAVRDAQPRAGQHRDRQFRDHRHIDDGAVARLVAARLQHVREARHQPEQLLIGDEALIARLALPQDGDLVLAVRGRVAIQAVVGEIHLGAREPARERRVPFEHLGPFFEPVDFLFGDLGPERFGILFRAAVQVAILFDAFDVGAAYKFTAGFVNDFCAHRNGLYQSTARRPRPLRVLR